MEYYDALCALRPRGLQRSVESLDADLRQALESSLYLHNVATVQKTYARVLKTTVNRSRTDKPVYPESVEESERYPDVDPKGKHSWMELEFAQRMAVLESSIALMDGADRQRVSNPLGLLQGNSCAIFQEIRTEMEQASRDVFEAKRAEKLCMVPQTAALLHAQADPNTVRAGSEGYRNFDAVLQHLEYAAGLRPAIAPAAREYVNGLQLPGHQAEHQPALDALKSCNRLPQRVPQRNLPTVFSFDFANYENLLRHAYWAHPANWNRTQRQEPDVDDIARGLEKQNAGALTAQKAAYCSATVERGLGVCYNAAERTVPGLQREDLIFIDGRSLAELARQQLAAQGLAPQNIRETAKAVLATALMNKNHVEAYLPDEAGKINPQPTRLTANGYTPSPLKKVVLNGWERFFNQHWGLYRQKAEKEATYERVQAQRQAMQSKVKAFNAVQPQYVELKKLQQAQKESIGQIYAQASQNNARQPIPDMGLTCAFLLADGAAPAQMTNAVANGLQCEQAGARAAQLQQAGDPLQRIALLHFAQMKLSPPALQMPGLDTNDPQAVSRSAAMMQCGTMFFACRRELQNTDVSFLRGGIWDTLSAQDKQLYLQGEVAALQSKQPGQPLSAQQLAAIPAACAQLAGQPGAAQAVQQKISEMRALNQSCEKAMCLPQMSAELALQLPGNPIAETEKLLRVTAVQQAVVARAQAGTLPDLDTAHAEYHNLLQDENILSQPQQQEAFAVAVGRGEAAQLLQAGPTGITIHTESLQVHTPRQCAAQEKAPDGMAR